MRHTPQLFLISYQVIAFFVTVNLPNGAGDTGNTDPVSNLASELINGIWNEVYSEAFLPPKGSYDFIVVGAGTAGCTIASRLTEVEDWTVLLIEAGGDENFLSDIPLTVLYQQFTPLNWNYISEPSDIAALGLENNQIKIPRGKVMGGSSVLDYMIYARGNKLDYDNWETLGNMGWGYKDVLPYFKKSEDNQVPGVRDDTEYHSTGGPTTVSYAPYRTPLGEAFVQAGLELGSDIIDYNGESQIGFSYLQTTLKNGSRWSATRAFIDPVRSRSNLHIRKRSYATKIILDKNSRAVGVEFVHLLNKYVVNARKEVIITAGAINTPQLLMLSGIGPSNHLKEVGIPVSQNLSVGYNLMDHVGVAPNFYINSSEAIRTDDVLLHPQSIIDYLVYKKGPFTSPGGAEAVAFLDPLNTDNKHVSPSVELCFLAITYGADPLLKTALNIRDDIYNRIFLPKQFAFGWYALSILMHPKSRGRILLKSPDPHEKPAIYLNYFSNEDDIDTIVSGIKVVLKLAKTNAFQKFGSTLYDIPLPACSHREFASDEYWKCYVRHLPQTIYHLSGTCKMGPSTDPDAVVDPRLNVYGIKGLRVSDASIIPVIPACHTKAVVYMIAERAADFVKEDWGKK